MNSQPAYLQNLPSRNLAQTAIANVGAGNPPYLSIQGNRFTLVDLAGNTIPIQTLHIDVVIVDINDHVSKIFFGLNKPYDPANPSPPICFSDNGLAPSIGSSQPQSPTCASCPQNVWGSKISQMGSAVKQCADQQKIAVYAPEYSDGLFLLRIPPGSFISWRSYMAKFAGAGLDPDRVITRISFEPNVVGTLQFQSPGYITEAMVPALTKMIEAKAADSIIGRLDKPRQPTLPAPSAAAPQVTAAVQEQPGPLASQPAPTAAPPHMASIPPASPPFPLPSAAQPQPGTPTPFPDGTATAASPSSQPQQPVQRRRRTKAEMEAARAPTPPAAPLPASAPAQAPFRPDPAPVQAPFADPAQPATAQPAQGQFGIVNNPPAPPAGLDLDSVFK